MISLGALSETDYLSIARSFKTQTTFSGASTNIYRIVALYVITYSQLLASQNVHMQPTVKRFNEKTTSPGI